LLPVTLATSLGVPIVMVPFDTFSVMVSESLVFGETDTVIALSDAEIPVVEVAVCSLTVSEAGVVSDTVVASVIVIGTVFEADELLVVLSVVCTDRLSEPY
jgi:hypothetical protein